MPGLAAAYRAVTLAPAALGVPLLAGPGRGSCPWPDSTGPTGIVCSEAGSRMHYTRAPASSATPPHWHPCFSARIRSDAAGLALARVRGSGAPPALLVARRRVTVAPRKRGVAWRASGSARARALRSRTCRVAYTRQPRTRNVGGARHGRP